MEDFADIYTEKTIEELEEKLREVYDKAYIEVSQKADKYFARFQSNYEEMLAKVEAEEITRAEFKKWYNNSVMMTEHWYNLRNELAEMMVNTDELAAIFISGEIPLVFLENYNFIAFMIESQIGYSTGFELISMETVGELLKGTPILHIDKEKALIWNEQHIQSAVLQGVLQGESIQHLSQRLRRVTDMDFRQSMRTARSTMTSAQNAGRQRRYEDAVKVGIKTQKQWLATHDSRTRHNHRILDGTIVDVDKPFKIGDNIELMYPGDPSAPASEYYNCRCTILPANPRFNNDIRNRVKIADGMTYDEWVEGKYIPKETKKTNKKTTQKPAQIEKKKEVSKVNKTTEKTVSKCVDVTKQWEWKTKPEIQKTTKPTVVHETKTVSTKFKTEKELDNMSLPQLKKHAEKIATEYYKNGLSSISNIKYTPEQMAEALVKSGTKTSLKKDIKSMQRKIKQYEKLSK